MEEVRINIGKRGIWEGIIEEIKRNLEDNKIVRVKFMKNIVRNKEEFENLVEELLLNLEDVEVLKKMGHTIVLKKRS